jgi:hypothetical protein
MDTRQTTGLAGAALLAIGVFVPLASMPIVGSITYFNLMHIQASFLASRLY